MDIVLIITEIQLYRRRSDDSGDWVVVRKKCPSCISKDCPNMLGGSEKNETSNLSGEQMDKSNLTRRNSFVQTIVDDFSSNGDKKILRAVGRTATVNAAVLMTAATGGVGASAIGYATGGAITAKRLSDGVAKNDEKEVTKSLAVFGAATGASIAGQALTGAPHDRGCRCIFACCRSSCLRSGMCERNICWSAERMDSGRCHGQDEIAKK